MASTVNIFNMSLGHLGANASISAIDEASAEARACRTFYEVAKEATLRDYRLPFSSSFKDLAMVEESPTTEWLYSYNYPNNCLFIRRIYSGLLNDTNDSRVPYAIGQDSNGQLLIYTNSEDARIEYTVNVSNPAIFPADFVLALSLRLATYIAPLVTQGDPSNLGGRAYQLYLAHIGRAVATANNENQPLPQPESDFIRSRE